ncbi:hypothetical protein GGP41_002034 [Bipolaris sorokiniana]|uniref:Ankyrin repeat protein n=1 Tax=Cochliobolus sativus TaxID=45130 RepID=A0A8H6DZ87_COCSA|nr:hypothetical protein GGP41_002034 [Bipolaris sorokiniana]
MQAAISGNITTLDSLMGFGFTVDTRADDQSTVLHCAARSGQARTVQYLLDKGASRETFNDKRRQPLHEAILSGNSDTLKALIQYTSEGQRPYADRDTMRYLALTKNMEVFDLYAGRLGIELTATDATKMLHYAIRAENDTIVAALLKHPEIELDGADVQGHAPIHKAAFYGSSKVMSLMLASDRINTSLTTAHENMSAIHIAARYGRTEIIEQMLHLVIRINYFDRDLCTALHHAAASGKLDTITLLLTFNGHWKAVQFFLKYNYPESHCDSMIKPPKNGEFIKKDVVSALLNHADFRNPNITRPGRKGNLLHCAARSGDDEVMAVLLAHEKIDVNERDSYRDNPLMVAAKRGHIEVVRLLLEHEKIDVNEQYFYRDNPLMVAAKSGHIEVVRLLLEHPKIDVNKQYSYRDNPLMVAAKSGQIEVARLLLQHPEIDVNIKDNWNLTPLQRARRNSHKEVVDLLLSQGVIDDDEVNSPTTTTETSNIPMAQDAGHTYDMDQQSELGNDPDFDLEGFLEDIPGWKEFSDAGDEMVE